MRSRPLAGVVLTGGASRRMGTDKAFVEVDGTPMVLRVVDAMLAAGCDPVECQGGDADRLASLGLDVVADDERGAGPSVAIRQAFARHPDGVVVAACDLPDLDAATVGRLVATVDGGAVAAAAATGGRHHLVVCLSSLADLGRAPQGELESVRRLLDRSGATAVEVDPSVVRNANRPTDLA